MTGCLRLSVMLCLWIGWSAGPHPACRLQADEPRAINPVGRPEKFGEGEALGYAVWYEAGYWELRATSPDRPGAKPKPNQREGFTGTITVEGGTIEEGRFEGLEGRKQQRDFDWVRMHPGRKGFDFHLVTKGKIDSLRFKVSRGAKTVQFKLLTNGDNVPERVRIGVQGERPQAVPFDLPAHPVAPDSAPVP